MKKNNYISLKKSFGLKLSNGFTLIEALVAISILMIAILSPMTIAKNGLTSAMFSKDEIVAQFLAQDAIEYIKNVRDVNSDTISDYQPEDWLNGLESCKTESGCEIDTISTVNPVTQTIDNHPLSFNSGLGTYNYKDGEPSKFTRVINITENLATSYQALVTVTVSWSTKKTDKYTLSTYIFNYR